MKVIVARTEFLEFLEFCGVDYNFIACIEIDRFIDELISSDHINELGPTYYSALKNNYANYVYSINDVIKFAEDFGDMEVLKANRLKK